MKTLSQTGCNKLIEEMGELQMALCKLMNLELMIESKASLKGKGVSKNTEKRRKRLREQVNEEMADVVAAMSGITKDAELRLRKSRLKFKRKRIKNIISIGKSKPVKQGYLIEKSTNGE